MSRSLLEMEREAAARAAKARAAHVARRAQMGRDTHNRQTGKKLIDVTSAPSTMEERFK